MTEFGQHHAEQIALAHRRLDAHDARHEKTDHQLSELKVRAAEEAVRSRHIEVKLNEISSGIRWVIGIVLGGFITAAVGYAMSGGFNVGP